LSCPTGRSAFHAQCDIEYGSRRNSGRLSGIDRAGQYSADHGRQSARYYTATTRPSFSLFGVAAIRSKPASWAATRYLGRATPRPGLSGPTYAPAPGCRRDRRSWPHAPYRLVFLARWTFARAATFESILPASAGARASGSNSICLTSDSLIGGFSFSRGRD